MADALTCSAFPESTPEPPVLLVHGTGASFSEDYGSNYMKWLPEAGYSWCAVQLPERGLDDLQRNVQYVVYAARKLYATRHERIDIIGHSQGATLPVLALKFWPDLARKTDDFFGFAGVYERGTEGARVVCAMAATCTPSFTQFKPESAFNAGFGSRGLPRGPSYTAFATRTDMIVTPAPEASRLTAPGVRNYVLQDLCPNDNAEHLTIVSETPLRELVLDGLAHRGPAVAERAAPVTCGFDTESGAETAPGSLTFFVGLVAGTSKLSTDTEPPVKCYLDPDCEKPRLRPRLLATAGRRVVRGRLVLPPGALDPCGGRVSVGRASARVRANCRFRVRVTTKGKPVKVRFRGTRELLPVAIRAR